MRFLTNYKFLAILEIILAALALFSQLSGDHQDMSTIEMGLNGILGIIGGILILKKNNNGIQLSRIWSFLQIPYFVMGTEEGVKYAFVFFQTANFKLATTESMSSMISLSQSYKSFGINLMGILLLLLFFKIKLSKKS